MAWGWGWYGDVPSRQRGAAPKCGPTQRTRKGKVKRGK